MISGNLFSEAESIAHRSSNLQARIDRIAVRVTQLDSTVEEGRLGSCVICTSLSFFLRTNCKFHLWTTKNGENPIPSWIHTMQCHFLYSSVSLQDIHLRKAFRSTQAFDQQVVSRDTMPKAMLEAYLGCDTPPPLSKLNPYR